MMDMIEKLALSWLAWYDNIWGLKLPGGEKFYLLSYIKAISNAGQDEKKAIKNKIDEYTKRKKYLERFMMEKVKRDIDKGYKLSIALFNAGVINEKEYHILSTAKDGMASGIEKIIETQNKAGKSKVAFALLLVPPSIILLALLFAHGAVKSVVEGVMQPIISAGGTPPPLPNYLVDPTTYQVANVLFFGVVFGVIGLMFYLKRNRPQLFMRLIPIIEEEYTMDILKSLHTVTMGGGINLSNAAKALSTGETNNIKKSIFEEIVNKTSVGSISISDILVRYGCNYNTVSSLKIGEDSGDINIGLNIAIEDIEGRYKRDIKLFTTIGMWGGQFAMLGIAGKPMIDIMLLMSVAQLNFQLN